MRGLLISAAVLLVGSAASAQITTNCMPIGGTISCNSYDYGSSAQQSGAALQEGMANFGAALGNFIHERRQQAADKKADAARAAQIQTCLAPDSPLRSASSAYYSCMISTAAGLSASGADPGQIAEAAAPQCWAEQTSASQALATCGASELQPMLLQNGRGVAMQIVMKSRVAAAGR